MCLEVNRVTVFCFDVHHRSPPSLDKGAQQLQLDDHLIVVSPLSSWGRRRRYLEQAADMLLFRASSRCSTLASSLTASKRLVFRAVNRGRSLHTSQQVTAPTRLREFRRLIGLARPERHKLAGTNKREADKAGFYYYSTVRA